jgi:hypothetical protein
MISAPFAHIGAIPIEETLASFGPGLLIALSAVAAKLRGWRQSLALTSAPSAEGAPILRADRRRWRGARLGTVRQHGPKRSDKASGDEMPAKIGAPGFEPGTSPTRTARATRLRHAPKMDQSTLASRLRP